MDYRAIQKALIARGFDCGEAGADGVWGRDSIAALKRFQAAHVPGLKKPGSIGPRTIAALNSNPATRGATPVLPAWYAEAHRKIGLHEKLNNAQLKKYLASDGHTLGDPAKQPWCGDFVETVIALTCPDERMVANPYWAQNWKAFGVALKTPAIGAIMVFVRPGGGHVGFYAGEDKGRYRVLGGNQLDRVSAEAWIEKKRLIAIRWPKTAALPTTGPVQLAGGGPTSTNEA